MKKLALALGGGSARGLAHIGFLKVIEKNEIPISRIAGCSMGAMVGGAYCLYQNIKDVEKLSNNFINNPFFKEFNFDDFASIDKKPKNWKEKVRIAMGRVKIGLELFKTLGNPSIFDEETMEKIYNTYPDVMVEDLGIPFYATSNDIQTGEEVILNEGSLLKIIRASSALPGYFPPVKIKNHLLVDGGVSNLVPTNVFEKNHHEIIVGVDVSQPIKRNTKLNSGIEIMQQAESIREYHLAQLKMSNADKIVSCKLNGYSWADFGKSKEIIAAGEKAGREFVKWYNQNHR